MHLFKKDSDLWDNIAANYSSAVRGAAKNYHWYHDELLPRILHSVLSKKTVLDFGCGDGSVANQIAKQGSTVTGYDISKKMIAIGKEMFPNIDLRAGDILQEKNIAVNYDAIVANMVLHDIKDITYVIKSLDLLLKKNGLFVFSIPHPCFYTELGKAYFDKNDQIVQIKRYKSCHVFTKFSNGNQSGVRHYHRPLTEYFKVFFELGYTLEGFEEIFEKPKNAEIPFAILFVFKNSRLKRKPM